MLENQIPLFVARKMMEFKFGSLEDADDVLFLMLIGLFKEICPFKTMEDYHYPNVRVISECAYLLDFCYDMIVPRVEQKQEQHGIVEVDEDEEEEEEEKNKKSTPFKLCQEIHKRAVEVAFKVKQRAHASD